MSVPCSLRQVFLQNTANIFQPGPRQVPNLLPVKNGEPVQPVSTNAKDEIPADDLDDFEKEPPTPTNCEPPPHVVAVEHVQVASITPSDSGSVYENGFVTKEDQDENEESNEEESEESKKDSDATSDFDSDSEAESTDPPFEALNHYVALPSVVVDDETPDANVEDNQGLVILPELQGLNESSDEPQPVQPKLAIQEDFDLSPNSETADLPGKPTLPLARALSKESVDSSKFAMTETEFSDWADNSLGGDLDAELEIDPEPVKTSAVKVVGDMASSPDSPVKPLSNGCTNLSDIEFADDSEERSLDLKGYTKLVEEVPTPDKSTNTPVSLLTRYQLDLVWSLTTS